MCWHLKLFIYINYKKYLVIWSVSCLQILFLELLFKYPSTRVPGLKEKFIIDYPGSKKSSNLITLVCVCVCVCVSVCLCVCMVVSNENLTVTG